MIIISRQKREFCESRCYHIMLRGNGKMDLFLDDNDFSFFLHILKKYKGETGTEIFAYCLMNNHVHMLLRSDNENLSLFLKKIGVSFSNYFNGKYEHVGHVFQNRYRSECINDNRYFISALRYIIRNPDQAGICYWHEYRWSSAEDYLCNNANGVTDLQFACDILGSNVSILKLFSAPLDCRLEEPKQVRRAISDTEAAKIINEFAGNCDFSFKKEGYNEEREAMIRNVLNAGVTVRQLERITGIGRGVIQKIKRSSSAA